MNENIFRKIEIYGFYSHGLRSSTKKTAVQESEATVKRLLPIYESIRPVKSPIDAESMPEVE